MPYNHLSWYFHDWTIPSGYFNFLGFFLIGLVRYIKILTWLRGFVAIFIYLVWCSLCSNLFWGSRDNGFVKNCNFGLKALECYTFNILNVGYWTGWGIYAPMHNVFSSKISVCGLYCLVTQCQLKEGKITSMTTFHNNKATKIPLSSFLWGEFPVT